MIEFNSTKYTKVKRGSIKLPKKAKLKAKNGELNIEDMSQIKHTKYLKYISPSMQKEINEGKDVTYTITTKTVIRIYRK